MSASERMTWYDTHCTDILELLKRNANCACCGAIPVECDHIIPLYRTSAGTTSYERLHAFEQGNIQFLCASCNSSKRNSAICQTHKIYLGVWNYLPSLDNLEIGLGKK